MSRKRWFAAAAVLVLVVVVSVVGLTIANTDEPEPQAEPEGTPAVYAYIRIDFGQTIYDSTSRLVLMDGEEFIGAETFVLAQDPVFTLDGEFVFVRASFLNEITAISVSTGETVTVPCEGCDDHFLECHCQAVVPVGGSMIAWLNASDRLVYADLAADPPTVHETSTVLPTEVRWGDEVIHPQLIAGTDGLAVASYPGESFDASAPIHLVPLEGEPTRLDAIRPDSVDQAAFSPDGAQVALTGDREFTCTTVTVVDIASGAGETTPVSADPGTTCERQDQIITAMWWDTEGLLNVIFESSEDDVDAPVHRRLEDGLWVDAETTDTYPLNADTALQIRDLDDEVNHSILELVTNGEPQRIDYNVSAVTLAP